jgi:SWI/SNF-related matrix-associated actin-dependent regulator of chromatin subfamily A-like protein 1
MPLPIFPYQDEGAQKCASRDRFGLHDEMGVGKTATIIRAMEYVGASRGLVIVPAMLRENWIGEYKKFSGAGLKLCKGMNIHDYIAWKRGKYDILITSYEQATKWSKDIVASGIVLDFVAIDEAHYLKNAGAARTKAILGPKFDGVNSAIEYALHVWHMTGTPMANDPLDIYPFLSMCRALNGMSAAQFTREFFYTQKTAYGARQSIKPEMLVLLQQLIQNNSIRRTQKEVGLHLPPIFLTTSLVDGDTKAIANLLKDYPGLDRAIENALEQGGLSFLDAQHVATLRRLIGEAKAVPYAETLLEELNGGADKRVVYGVHKDALYMVRDYLLKHGIKCVVNNGDTPERDRMANVNAFQTQADVRVFIGNIKAAGVGLTLTASCEIDMLESDWSPAGNAQAVKRIHRIGQTRTVRARFITLARSFDETVNRIVASKTASIAQVEGDFMPSAPLDSIAQFV